MADEFTLEQLLAVAYRRECAQARRRAARDRLPLTVALVQVLEDANAGVSIAAIVAHRLHDLQAAAERRSMRQQAARERFAQKKAAALPDPSAWHAWFDGSATPNPGRIGIGALLVSPQGRSVEISLQAGVGDGNDAEYAALIALLEKARELAVANLVVHGDSRIVIGDALLDDATGSAVLAGPRLQARHLLAGFASIRLVWIPRARNARADALARQALQQPDGCR